MRTQLVIASLLLALSASHARADERTAWEGVMVGSVGVAFAGGALLWHGSKLIDHAEDNLCTGAYDTSCDHAPPADPTALKHFNANGNDGDRDVKLGAALLIGGTALGVVALIEAYVVHKTASETMMITPAVTPTGAGATFQMRW